MTFVLTAAEEITDAIDDVIAYVCPPLVEGLSLKGEANGGHSVALAIRPGQSVNYVSELPPMK